MFITIFGYQGNELPLLRAVHFTGVLRVVYPNFCVYNQILSFLCFRQLRIYCFALP